MSKEQFFNFLWKLHNICRNGRGVKITNIPAMYETNNIITLKLLEIHNLEDKYDVPENCRFNYIYDNFCSKESNEKEKKEYEEMSKNKLDSRETVKNYYKIYNHYCNPENTNNVVYTLCRNKHLEKIYKSATSTPSAYAVKNKPEVGYNVIEIFKAVQEQFGDLKNISVEMNMFSDAYEEWKTSSDGNGSKLTDQHFTPSEVQEYVIDEIKINEKDIFYEPCGGGGGFGIQAKKYLKRKGEKTIFFDENCIINEINPEIHRLLFTNMLINEISVENKKGEDKIKDQDSLNLSWCKKIQGKVNKIGSNPPFSMKDTIPYDEYFGPLTSSNKKTCIKNGTALFVIHNMQSLAENGVCGMIVDRGILNNGNDKNSWEKRFRKYVFENVNLYKITLLPKGIFPYTTFDTAIIFFKKNGATQTCKIVEADFKNSKNKTGIKDKQTIKEITLQELQEKDFNLSEYIKNDDNKQENYEDIEYKTLGDVCEFITGKYNTQDFEKLKNLNGIDFYCGQYNSPIGKINGFSYDSKEPYIIFTKGGGCHTSLFSGSQGYCNSYYIENGKSSFCSVNIAFIKIKTNPKYLYYVLKFIKNILRSNTKFSGNLGSLNLSFLEKFKIPILTSDHQSRIVKFMDQQLGQDYKILDRLVQEFKDIDLFKFLLFEDYDTLEVAIKMIKDLINYENQGKKCYDTRRSWCFRMVASEEKKLGEVCECQFGTRITKSSDEIKSDYIGHKYPVYGGGGATFETNKFNRDTGTLIISRFGVSPNCVRIVNEKFWLHDNGMSIIYKNINKNYLDKYLLLNQLNIYNNFTTHNAQARMQTDKLFREFKIPVPSPEDQQKVIQMIESINKEESDFNQSIKSIQQNIKYMYECVEQLVNTSNQNVEDNNEEQVDEVEGNHLEDVNEEEEENEYEEITFEEKAYYVKDKVVYHKKKNGNVGKECGKLKKNGDIKFTNMEV